MRTLFLLILAGSCLHAAERTILFVDDDDILYRAGHDPAGCRTEAVLRRSGHRRRTSRGRRCIGWTSVHRDPKTGKYQLWYQAYQERRVEDKTHEVRRLLRGVR